MEKGSVSLIIQAVSSTDIAATAQEFAAAFSLEQQAAEMILSAAPIVFVLDLTKQELRAITPKLIELSKKGMEFKVMVSTPPKLPRVNWPVRPQFTAGWTGSSAVGFDWQDLAFICPSCGETFLFKRLGAAQAKEKVVDVKPESVEETVEAPIAEPEPEPEKEVIDDELKKFAEADVAPTEGRLRRPEEPASGGPVAAEPEELQELEPLEEEKPAAKPAKILEPFLHETDVIEVPDTGEEVVLEKPDVSGKEKTSTIGQISSALEAQLGEVRKEEKAKEPKQPEELYNVFVPEIKDSLKREDVVRILCDIKGCSQEEARKLAKRLIIPVAKGIPRNKAEEIIIRFKKIRIIGRMVKVTPAEAKGE